MEQQHIDTIYSIIGSRIREYRKKTQLSQEDLAFEVDVSRTSIVNIERGRQRLPIHLLWNIADVLDVEPSSFLPEREQVYQQPKAKTVDDETLKTIDYKSQGNPETRKKLLEFVIND